MLDDSDARSQSVPTLGTKIAFLAALPFIFYGAAILLSPITDVRTTAGAVFDCGTAISMPSDAFQKGICQGINQQYLYRGIAFVASGLGIAALGAYLFGFTRQIERADNTVSTTDEEPRGNRRRSFDNDQD